MTIASKLFHVKTDKGNLFNQKAPEEESTCAKRDEIFINSDLITEEVKNEVASHEEIPKSYCLTFKLFFAY